MLLQHANFLDQEVRPTEADVPLRPDADHSLQEIGVLPHRMKNADTGNYGAI